MKRGRHDRKHDHADLGEFERKARKNKNGKRYLNQDEEMEFQSWMNRPSNSDDSDFDDFQSDIESRLRS